MSDTSKSLRALLREQVELLANWNEENIEFEGTIEQIRKNVETIIHVLKFIEFGE